MKFRWILALSTLALSVDARAEKFEEMEIEGEVHKPEVSVFISRENLNKSMELAKLERSFLELVTQAVAREPF